MTPSELVAEFSRRLSAAIPDAKLRKLEGASNLPFKIDAGFRLGIWNLTGLKATDTQPLLFASRLMLPPDRTLFLALRFRGAGLADLIARVDQMRAEGREPKNVRFYIHPNGIYLALSDIDSLATIPPEAGQPVRADVAYYADIEHGSNLDPVEVSFVQFVRQCMGTTPLVQLGAAGASVGGAPINLASALFPEIERRIHALGAVYIRSLLERYHVALNHLSHKHFVLLTGISGTGKTMLARTYAYAALGIDSLKLPSANVYLIAVRPDWTEPAHLLGFMDMVSGRYQRTRFVEALLQAHHDPTRPVFVCLDEMNLAQPEHYFADVLSAMESGEPIHLHNESQDVGVPRSIDWPGNLYIVGTVNMDETTRPFSPKVLDRANVIDMSAVDIDAFCAGLKSRSPELVGVLDQPLVDRLKRLSNTLAPHGLHFGYRVIEEIAKYVAFSTGHGLLADALDVQVEQKILTKLRGGPEHEKMLNDLFVILDGLPRSRAAVERMRSELSLYESFQFWR
ncbi:hypothetical protein D7Y21_07620 [Corallococcus sp. AB045]|uniref:McrB family protein n=1 Tax=Corallococcus sp. AB045 TaxID=2316719 RepID=UPI000EE15726|nr:AAA family ATPase [Corallococcus sp. AB045]RKH90181.1 hypothetical protein D7Y21_07620 [Corallococcus sp. AB045]